MFMHLSHKLTINMNFNLYRIFHLALIIIFLSGFTYSMAGQTYKWVDKNGKIHLSDRAPDDPTQKTTVIRHDENEVDEDTEKTISDKPPEKNINPLEHTVLSTFTIKGSRAFGSGFFISPNGYAVTCRHVIEKNGNHTAVMQNQEEYSISVISKSYEHDLALILVTTLQRTPYLEFRDPFSMKAGEKVYAVGSSAGLQSTITDGVFTGIRKHETTEKRAVQFSAPVNPGNSGGPLIDKNGKVIGAVSWKLLSNNGIQVSGIGFAVPSDYILDEYRGYIEER